jgi:excisionase family DNA binding protein
MNMNATMVRKFCTLEEAAERLNTTQEQIENLLRKGVLREFRNGSHRLLRTADVGAIVAARTRRLERQGQPVTRSTPRPVDEVRLPRAPDAAPQGPRRDNPRPRATDGGRRQRDLGHRPAARRPASAYAPELPPLSDSLRRSRGRARREVPPPRPTLSVRQWFWTGLLQDRPVAIALLSGLVLLGLSALVAGVCVLTDTL